MLIGEQTIDVDAAPEACFALVEQLDRQPEWQSLVRRADVLERDADGRALVVDTVAQTPVRTLGYRLRYAYDPPRELRWTYVDGDVRDLEGSYRFEPVDGGRTRVTFRLAVDPGRRLGLLLRGPVADSVRAHVLGTTLAELKRAVEAGGLT